MLPVFDLKDLFSPFCCFVMILLFIFDNLIRIITKRERENLINFDDIYNSYQGEIDHAFH